MLAPSADTVPVCVGPHTVPLVTVNVAGVFTVTVAVVLTVQVPAVPVIEYVCVELGFAVTLAPFALLKLPAGLHVNVVGSPLAVKVKLVCPWQMEPELTARLGLPITLMVVVAVVVQE